MVEREGRRLSAFVILSNAKDDSLDNSVALEAREDLDVIGAQRVDAKGNQDFRGAR
jgi:hypothetical protein